MEKNKVVLFFPILEKGKKYHWPPISLLALAAVIKNSGFDCVILDKRVEKNIEERLKKELKDALCLGLTGFTGHSLKHSLEAAKICREFYPNIPIIFGGPHATALPEQTKKSRLVDDVVTGYGEFNFLEKIKRISKNQEYKGSVDPENTHKKLISPEMPTIPYEIIDMKKYISPETEATTYITSYGCPGKCTFCSTSTLRAWAPFSLNKISRDLDNLFHIYPFKHLVFYDATFLTDIHRAMKIGDYIQKYNVTWSIDARTTEAVNLSPSIIKKLEKYHLKNITIGLETGSNHVVKIINKGEGHVERMYKIINNFKNSPIKITSGIIFGIPGETLDDLKTTLKVIRELCLIKKDFKFSTTFFRPLPDTNLYKILIEDYGFSFPQSLEEWAKHGERSHYLYNTPMSIPWFEKEKEKGYHEVYEEFWQKNKNLLAARTV